MGQGVHIPNFAALPNVELVALAETRPKLGELVQKRWGFRTLHRSHHEIAQDPEVAAVGVSAGMSAQGEIARDLARAGKHVFMEKPMAISVAQADEMLEASRAGGGRIMIAYMKRYDAGNEIAKEEIDVLRSGESPFYARAHGFCGDWVANYDWAGALRTDEPYPSGHPERYPAWLPEDKELRRAYVSYLQQWTHNLNLLRWFLDAGDNAEVSWVSLDGETGVVGFTMNGVRAIIESGVVEHHGWEEHTQVYFGNGWVRVSSPPLLLKNVPAEVEVYRAGVLHEYRRPVPAWSWAYRREAEHFVESVLTGTPFRSSAEDARTDVSLFEEVFKVVCGQARSV
jgi:predicted dehydrogenase